MVVITRKVDQWVHLFTKSGEKISVCVNERKGRYTRIGFIMPDSTVLVREESVAPLLADGIDLSNVDAVRLGISKLRKEKRG